MTVLATVSYYEGEQVSSFLIDTTAKEIPKTKQHHLVHTTPAAVRVPDSTETRLLPLMFNINAVSS